MVVFFQFILETPIIMKVGKCLIIRKDSGEADGSFYFITLHCKEELTQIIMSDFCIFKWE